MFPVAINEKVSLCFCPNNVWFRKEKVVCLLRVVAVEDILKQIFALRFLQMLFRAANPTNAEA